MLSTPDRFTAEVSFRPGVTQLNNAIEPEQRDLLAKLRQNGVGQVFERVFPGLKFPTEFRTNPRVLRGMSKWVVTAVPWDPDGLLLHINQFKEDRKVPTGALQIGYSGEGLLFVASHTRVFEQIIGESVGDFEGQFEKALENVRDNPRVTLFGHI